MTHKLWVRTQKFVLEATKVSADNFVADFNDFVTLIHEFTEQADSMGKSIVLVSSLV